MRWLLAVVIVTSLVTPLVARAQTSTIPSYATREEIIQGTISGFNGAYTVFVRDDRGFIDNVTLRNGTIINPTGLRLSQGQQVTIYGFTQGNTFVANQIDTPYTISPPVYGYAPPPAYYGVGLSFGYPFFGGYYYGPLFGLGLAFGFPYYGRFYYGRPYYPRGYYGRPYPYYGRPYSYGRTYNRASSGGHIRR